MSDPPPARKDREAFWIDLLRRRPRDELADFEERTFRHWDRASLKGLRGAIQNRWRQLGGR